MSRHDSTTSRSSRATLVGLLALSLFAAGGCGDERPRADLILTNGSLITVDDERPVAQALAVRDGLIVAVGTDAEIDRYRSEETEVLDLDGKLAIPGFIEGHAHFTGLGESLMIVNLRDAHSWQEVVQRVADAAAQTAEGRWVLGRGWHQEKWDTPVEPNVEGYPLHELLSAATPDHPVALTHASGHAAMINRRAMDVAGISAETPDPEGGLILRDPAGQPTGLLRETAETMVERAIATADQSLSPEERAARRRREIELATRDCLSKGVTSFQDAGTSFATVETLAEAARDGTLGVRLWVMLNEDNDSLERAAGRLPIRTEDGMLTVRAVKRVMDGALGSHGAWLLEPYTDLPETSGLNTIPIEELERTARISIDQGLQLCVHAIGDRANRETLDVFERAFEANPDRTDLRWRVEHAQHLHPDDLPRFAELGVIASVQCVHCTSDGPWVAQRLGEQRTAQGAYLWRTLIDSGAVVSNGTDAPVEDVDPIANFYSSITREMNDGRAFYPDQRMTREEALRSYTIDAAYAAFEDDVKGSLTPGKMADITVLSHDILNVPEDQVLGTQVLYTIVGGRIVYRHPGS